MAFVRAALSIEGVTDPLPPPVVVNAALTLRLAFTNAGGAPVAVSGAQLLISRPDGVELAVPAGTMDAGGTGVWLYTLLLDQGGQWRFRAACDDAATPDLPVTVTGSALSPPLPTGPILVDETGLPLAPPEGGTLTLVRVDRLDEATDPAGLNFVAVAGGQSKRVAWETVEAAAAAAGADIGAVEGAEAGATAGAAAGAAAGASAGTTAGQAAGTAAGAAAATPFVAEATAQAGIATTKAGEAAGSASAANASRITTQASEAAAATSAANAQALTGIAVSNVSDTAASLSVLDPYGGVIAEFTTDGRDLVLPYGVLRVDDGKLVVMFNEAAPDASSPTITRDAAGVVRFGLAGLSIAFDPTAGTVVLPGIDTAAVAGFLAKVAATADNSFALVDPYGGVMADFGFGGITEISGFVFDCTAKSITAPDGTQIYPPAAGGLTTTTGGDGTVSLSNGISSLRVGGVAGAGGIGDLDAARIAEDSHALCGPYGDVRAEFGTTFADFAGYSFGPTGITDPNGTSVYTPPSGSTYTEPRIDWIDQLPTLTTDADADALIAAHANVPTLPRRILIYQTIAKLKASGAWAALDLIYMDDAKDAQAAGLNWKSPASFAKPVSAPQWESDRGSTGNGTSYGEDTGWQPSVNGVNFTLNSCCMALEIASNVSSAAFDVGVGSGLALCSRTGGAASLAANDAGATAIGTVTSSVGIIFGGRIDAATKAVALGTGAAVTAASASTSIPAGTLKLHGAIAGTYSTRRIKKLMVGAWLSDAQRASVVDAMNHWSKGVGSYIEADTSGTPQISRDVATYGAMTSQVIPSIERFGSVILRANYGINNAPLGTNGEVAPCYVRLSQSRDGGITWTHGAFFVPQFPSHAVIDPHLCRLLDGRALLCMPYTGGGVTRSVWGCIIDNPTDRPADWIIGKPCFLDYGFVGRPRYRQNGQLRYTANENSPGVATKNSKQGMKYCSLSISDGAVRSDRISYIPDAAVDGSINSFYEASVADLLDGRTRAVFRADTGIWTTTSADEVTWSTPTLMTFPGAGVVSRVDIARSPSGRLMLAAHGATGARDQATLYMTEIGGDGSAWPYSVMFDARAVSYFSLAFSRTVDNQYTGEVLVAGDGGRGKPATAPIYRNELWVAHVDEASVVAGAPKFFRNSVIQ